MKYAVLAALLATSNANTQPCDDANTGDEDAQKAVYDALTTSLAEKLDAAEKTAAAEAELFKTANDRSIAAKAIADPFKEAFTVADNAHKAQLKISNDWATENSAIGQKVIDSKKALDDATGERDATQLLIDGLETELTNRKAAVAEALAEKTTENAALQALVTDTATKKGLYDTQVANYETSRAKIAALKTVDPSLAKTIDDTNTTKTTECAKIATYASDTMNGLYTTMETESVKLQQCEGRKTLLNAPCVGITACLAGDPVKAIVDAKSCSTTDYDTAVTAWEKARKHNAALENTCAQATVAKQVADDALTAEKTVRDGFLGDPSKVVDADGYMSEDNRQLNDQGVLQIKKLTVYTDYTTALAKETTQITSPDGDTEKESPKERSDRYDEQYKRIVLEQGITEGKLYDKKKQLDLDNAKIAGMQKTYDADKAVETGATDKTNAIKADLDVLAALLAKAKAIDDRAQLRVAFYQTFTSEATTSQGKADKLVEEIKAAQAQNVLDLEAVAEKIKVAIRECKGRGYAEAQAALAAFNQKGEDDKAAYKKLKDDYAESSKQGSGGAAGTRCEYPAPKEDGTQEPRPTCNEELCCGAANRFEKNGTKLTIESCQNAKDTTTYTYWPPLPEGAIVAPRSETWRFSCIGGAQQLAVTASAAVAAIYMMN